VKMERLVKAKRDEQCDEHQLQREQVVRDSDATRRKLEQEDTHYKMIEKEHTELRLLMTMQSKESVRKQWKQNQLNRYHEYTLPETEYEHKRNMPFFQGLRSTVPDQPAARNYSTSILFH
jgi:hypothetical protein